MVSIIMCVYNAFLVANECIHACLRTLKANQTPWRLILVDNHSPDDQTRALLGGIEDRQMPGVMVVVPHSNLGCHNGWNYGYLRARQQYPETTHCVKLDDDAEMQTEAWADKMVEALEVAPGCAFVSADISPEAKRGYEYDVQTVEGIDFEIPRGGEVGFSCVMFRGSWIAAVGDMKPRGYRSATGTSLPDDSLYGGEEVYYAIKARDRGQWYAHLPSVFAKHHGNEHRPVEYVLWKFFYGYLGRLPHDMDCAAWMATRARPDCQALVAGFLAGTVPSGLEPYVNEARRLLEQFDGS